MCVAPVYYWGKLEEKIFEPVADSDYGNIMLCAFLLVLMYVSYSQFTYYLLSEVIRAEAETCFPMQMLIQNYLMLLLFLMINITLVHTKVKTTKATMQYLGL